MDNQLIVFDNEPIRRIEHEGETCFSIVDSIEILTDSTKPRDYWSVQKKREPQLPTVCWLLKLPAKRW